MRQINGLQVGNLNPLVITAVDTPTVGAPQGRYEIQGFNTGYNPANRGSAYPAIFNALPIFFHTGPIYQDTPLNGVTEESLLMVVADRLRSKLGTGDATVEDHLALESILMATNVLASRSQMAYSSMDQFAARQSA
jgi:hypothetical protein